jgi:hypothetical protein
VDGCGSSSIGNFERLTRLNRAGARLRYVWLLLALVCCTPATPPLTTAAPAGPARATEPPSPVVVPNGQEESSSPVATGPAPDDGSPQWVTALDAACAGGKAAACLAAGSVRLVFEPASAFAQAWSFYAQGCDLQEARACVALAGVFVASDPTHAAVLFARGCAVGDAGCYGLAEHYDRLPEPRAPVKGALSEVVPEPTFQPRAQLLSRSCTAGLVAACAKLAELNGAPAMPEAPTQWVDCRLQGEALACANLGWSRHHPKEGPPDLEGAAEAYGHACLLGASDACAWLAELRAPPGLSRTVSRGPAPTATGNEGTAALAAPDSPAMTGPKLFAQDVGHKRLLGRVDEYPMRPVLPASLAYSRREYVAQLSICVSEEGAVSSVRASTGVRLQRGPGSGPTAHHLRPLAVPALLAEWCAHRVLLSPRVSSPIAGAPGSRAERQRSSLA